MFYGIVYWYFPFELGLNTLGLSFTLRHFCHVLGGDPYPLGFGCFVDTVPVLNMNLNPLMESDDERSIGFGGW
jgi:hypothetical protein